MVNIPNLIDHASQRLSSLHVYVATGSHVKCFMRMKMQPLKLGTKIRFRITFNIAVRLIIGCSRDKIHSATLKKIVCFSCLNKKLHKIINTNIARKVITSLTVLLGNNAEISTTFVVQVTFQTNVSWLLWTGNMHKNSRIVDVALSFYVMYVIVKVLCWLNAYIR